MSIRETYKTVGGKTFDIVTPEPLAGSGGDLLNDNVKATADVLEALAAVGVSGFSGYSGRSGYSGATGPEGAAGASGYSGGSGYSGPSGFSGYSGRSGFSGYSAFSGYSGKSGYSGFSGTTGCSAQYFLNNYLETVNGVEAISGSFTLTLQSNGTWAAGNATLGWTLSKFSGLWFLIGNDTTGDGGGGISVSYTADATAYPNCPPADESAWTWLPGSQDSDVTVHTLYSVTNLYTAADGASGFSGWAGCSDTYIVGMDGGDLSGVNVTLSRTGGRTWAGSNGTTSATITPALDDWSITVVDSVFGTDGWTAPYSLYPTCPPVGFDVASAWTQQRSDTGDNLTVGNVYQGSNGAAGSAGASGFSGYSGKSGYSGPSGFSGYSGGGTSGFSGYSGGGTSGFSGYSGKSGYSGPSGFSGYSGASSSGFSGYSGPSGFSGYSGKSGYSGFSGYSGSGISGYSGSGVSGYSGAGLSGFSGYSGKSGYSGPSGFSGYSAFSGYSGSIPTAIIGTTVALTDGATINTNAALGNTFTVTLGGSRTMAAPTNALAGQKIVYQIKQDGSGNRTLSWTTGSAGAFRFSGATAPVLTTTAGKTDYLTFLYNGVDSRWDNVGERYNF